ncbi:MAG: threonine/serine dehydratase [Nocardioidaceae bacterium]
MERSDIESDLLRRIGRAEQLIRPYVVTTPLDRLHLLADDVAGDVRLKCEHLQRTGSFKARGALAKLLTLTQDQRRQGIVTASTGNHGQGMAYALAAVGGRGLVFVPRGAAEVKVAAIRRYGVEVRQAGDESGQTERAARQFAAAERLIYVSPYNDLDVIAGQGTVGLELIEQWPDGPDTVVVAVGGGGLISGIATALRSRFPRVHIVGACPSNDAAMYAAVRAGRPVPYDRSPTLSDGTAGGLEDDAVTIELCDRLVDRWVLVDEPEIAAALRLVIDSQHQLVEGSAALAVAAARSLGDELSGRRVVVVSCGGNISSERLVEALTLTT